MWKTILLALILALLALVPLGTATANEETHCYIIDDVCVIISNVCFLDTVDCGDGTDWFSKRAWVRGWCIAAIYAEVIVGTVEECLDGKARTVAEKVPISSVNGMLVLWQSQLEQYRESKRSGNQERQEQRSSASGSSSQRTSANGGSQQPGNQQGTGQNDGNPPPIDPQQPDNSPPDNGNPNPIYIVNNGEDKEDQNDLLNKILGDPKEPQYEKAEGPKGEQQQEETYLLSEVTHNGAGRHWSDGQTCMEYANAEKTRVRKCQSGGNEGGTFKGDPPLGTNSLPQRCAWCRAGNGVPIYTPTTPANGDKNGDGTRGSCSWDLVHRFTSDGLQSSNWVYNCQ